MRARRVDPAEGRFKDCLPACVKCKRYQPGGDLDPFGEETKCAVFGEIPKEYLLMSDACDKLDIAEDKAFMNVGDRPLTMLERMARDR